jgi:hypothetical protein
MTTDVQTEQLESEGTEAESAAAPPAFSSEEVARLLALIKDSESVELKLTVPELHQRSTAVALGLDPLAAQLRQVFFFDTPQLTLDKHGVVVRARRVQGKGDDSVVKLRPVVPGELPKELRMSDNFRVEVDALPGGFVCSGTMKEALGSNVVREALAAGQPVRKLFSKGQRRFFSEHAPDGVSLDDLSVLGPIFVLKLRFAPKELRQKLVAEMWLYPDGSRILELSTRCPTNEAFQQAAELRAYLAVKGVEITGDQETKTRKALRYFASAAKAE